jgi:hypothetical protein
MQQKFNVGFVTFSYGGNGGISSEVPDIREWMTPLVVELSRDPRIDQIRVWNLADTPITMTRNRAVLQAREFGVDVLVMIDSDMKPDTNAGQPDAKPFFQSSFDFLVDHYHKGPCIIGVPYCGPPPVECVYVFRWQNIQTGHPNPDFQLEMYDRHTAVKMSGIQECAALPTGLIMYDMRVFDLTEPKDDQDKPWFYYEFKDRFQADKASTEDVTMTRDVSLVGTQKLGFNPVYCNWDAWAGHWKPKCVGKPQYIQAKDVSAKLKDCWECNYEAGATLVELNGGKAIFGHPGARPSVVSVARYSALSDGNEEKMAWLRERMDAAPKGVFVEVGNREGGSLLMAVEHPNSTAVYGIDPYGAIPYRIPNGPITTEYDDDMRRRMESVISASPHSGKATLLKMTSDQYMSTDRGDSSYAFVYLDGSHEPDVVGREIKHFRSRMGNGGIIVVDDTETLPAEMLAEWVRWKNMAWIQSVRL